MVAYQNLYGKVQQIYTILGKKVPNELSDARTSVSLTVMIRLIENLLIEIERDFYVAQSHPARLKKVLGWIYALREEAFGSQKNTKLSDSELL